MDSTNINQPLTNHFSMACFSQEIRNNHGRKPCWVYLTNTIGWDPWAMGVTEHWPGDTVPLK
jgi:hypothetical protein